MKKLALIVLLVVGFSTFAQEGKQDRKGGEREKLSAEQKNQLQVKKMTMELNLNESQQKEMSKLMSEQSSKREAAMAERKASKEKGVKLTADERFKMQSQRLDDQAAMKDKVQKILTADQYKKWEELKKEKKEHMKDRMEKREGKRAEKKSAE